LVQGYIFILCPFSPCSPAFDIISSSVSPLTTTQQHEQTRVFPGNFPARQRAMVHPTHTMTCSDSRDHLIILSIFGLFYGFSFGGQFARAATWLIESAGKQSAEAMVEDGLDRRCIWAYGIGIIRTTSLLCEAPSHIQIFCCQQLLLSIPGIRRPCTYSRHLHYHIAHCESSAR
jgi:hypothetical protein